MDQVSFVRIQEWGTPGKFEEVERIVRMLKEKVPKYQVRTTECSKESLVKPKLAPKTMLR